MKVEFKKIKLKDTTKLKTYKIKNHDSGKTYKVKAKSFNDAKDKYNKFISIDSLTEDAYSYTKYYLRRIRDKFTFSGVRGMWDEEIASYSFKKQENPDAFISIIKKFVDFNMTKSELLSRAPGFVMSFDSNGRQLKDSLTEDADFYGTSQGSEKADDILFALQVMYGEPKYTYGDFQKMNLPQSKINEALAYVKKKGYNKFSYFDSLTEDADFYGTSQGSEKADDILFALQVMYGEPKYTYGDFQKMNLPQSKINEALAYVKKKGYNKFSYFDSLTEDADIAQIDIKSSYLPEDANAENIKYLGFNELRKISFYQYGDNFYAHYDLTGAVEKIDKDAVQRILKKNIIGEIDEDILTQKQSKNEEIVKDSEYERYTLKTGRRSDAFKQYLRDRGLKFEPSQNGNYTEFVVFNADESVDRRVDQIIKTVSDSTVTDKLIGNGEVHFTYKGGRVITGAWNKNKLNEREISSILNKYNCKREQARWNDIVFSTRIGNEENLCKAFNEINPSYSVSELLSLHDSKERGDK